MKYSLAEKYGEDRIAYTEPKVPLTREIMRKADRWSQEVGWEPGPGDA